MALLPDADGSLIEFSFVGGFVLLDQLLFLLQSTQSGIGQNMILKSRIRYQMEIGTHLFLIWLFARLFLSIQLLRYTAIHV